MQIGTRWGVGEPAPASLPAPLRAAIDDEERVLVELGADTRSWRWTLTWLEGDPVVQLDDGTTLRLSGDEVAVSRED